MSRPRHRSLVPGGMGLLVAPDPRDQRHTLGSILSPAAAAKAPASRMWQAHGALDQGFDPACVGFAWTMFRLSAPFMVQMHDLDAHRYALALYRRAQTLDEWPGEDYEGTSIRAGAKALREEGHIAEYLHAWDLNSSGLFLRSRGPVIDAVPWFTMMFTPDKHGYVEPTGNLEGWHALLRVGYSARRRASRWLNSWDESWGQGGRCWIHDDALGDLFPLGAQSISAIETKTERRWPVTVSAGIMEAAGA